MQARIELIERRRDIALMERPECKRRWATPSWASRRDAAVRGWLLDRLEDHRFWYAVNPDGDPEPLVQTVRTLGAAVEQDAELVEVARMWAADALGTPDADVTSIVGQLVDDEHVPYLAAYRYKGKGLTKRADWERTWDLQREEDRIAARVGQDIGDRAVREAVRAELGTVPVPPKYGPPDFVRPGYWSARGKLDVPKERFVSYPGASRDGDGSLTLGWAGWGAVDRAQALAALVTNRRDEDGWGADRITPLLAGLAEQLPWVAQWHPDVDPHFGVAPGDIYGGFLANLRNQLQLTEDDLTGWRPTGRVDVSPLPRIRAARTPRTAEQRGHPRGHRPGHRRRPHGRQGPRRPRPAHRHRPEARHPLRPGALLTRRISDQVQVPTRRSEDCVVRLGREAGHRCDLGETQSAGGHLGTDRLGECRRLSRDAIAVGLDRSPPTGAERLVHGGPLSRTEEPQPERTLDQRLHRYPPILLEVAELADPQVP